VLINPGSIVVCEFLAGSGHAHASASWETCPGTFAECLGPHENVIQYRGIFLGGGCGLAAVFVTAWRMLINKARLPGRIF
jgi:hypothetical protein